jgi:hypothetical protein
MSPGHALLDRGADPKRQAIVVAPRDDLEAHR